MKVRTSRKALVRCLWVVGQARAKYLKTIAATITETQQRNRRARLSHRKAKLRRLHDMGIRLTDLQTCIIKHKDSL